MSDLFTAHPEVMITIIKWLVSLLGFCAASFISLFIYIFKQMKGTMHELSSSLKSLEAIVASMSESLVKLWAEHNIISDHDCDKCAANRRHV